MNKRYFYSLPRREIIFYPGILSHIRKNLFLFKKYHRGRYAKIFEEKFADYIGVNYALSVGSGRCALATILRALKLERGDEIILSAYNFPQLVILIKSLGLKPVLVDINRETLNIDIQKLKERITKRTKVIIITHFFGQPAEVDKVKEVAKKYRIFLIEDCAHSCGAEYHSKKVGSIGDAGFFSFSVAKNMNTFLGGMVTTNSKDLFMEMKREIDTYKLLPKFILIEEVLKGLISGILLNRRVYPFTVWPFIWLGNLISSDFDILRIRRYLRFKGKEISDKNLQFSDFQAFVGLKQMEFLDVVNKERAERAEKLRSLLNPSIQTQSVIPGTKPVYSFFLLIAQHRERVAKKLISKGIDVDIGFMRNCAFLIDKKEIYPSSEWIDRNGFLIRLRHSIPIEDIYHIANVLNSIL